MGAMATYVRAGLPEVATALAALTGEPHPLAIKDPGTGPAPKRATRAGPILGRQPRSSSRSSQVMVRGSAVAPAQADA